MRTAMRPKNVDPSFGDRLVRAMRKAGKSRSDVARELWGTILEKRGDDVYEVARNRQMISRYVSGRTFPSEETKVKLCEILDTPFQELFPQDDPAKRKGSGVELHQVDKKHSLLDLHVVLPNEKAMEIIKLVQECMI